MTWKMWVAFTVTEAVLCFTPGPAVLLVLSQALARGTVASIWSNLGVLGGNTIYFILSATGLGVVLMASYELFSAIRWIGAAYLIWLGVTALLGTSPVLAVEPSGGPKETLAMAQPVYDETIISQFLAVSTPNVSDALDRLQIAGAPQGILPLFPSQKIVGHAATLKLVPAGEAPESAVNGTLAAIVKGGRGAVLVIDGSSSAGVNSYGGVAGATSKHNGLVGCVSDSLIRDVDEYKAYGLPVYAKGITQQSIRGRSACAGHGIEVALGGVKVRPGDLVIADDNGVCVVPQDKVREVLEFAQLVKATEERLIAEIRAGVDPIAAHERVKYDSLLRAT